MAHARQTHERIQLRADKRNRVSKVGMRSLLAIATFLLLTSLRAADIATTLDFDPYLRSEGNPVVFFLGGKLGSLLFTNGIIWLVCVGFLFMYWRGHSLKIPKSPRDLREYVRTCRNRVVKPRRAIRDNMPGG